MKRIAKSTVVNAPLHAVYNQWTQFETFPRFMEGIKEVRQLDDTRLHWCAKVAGKDDLRQRQLSRCAAQRSLAQGGR